MASRKTVWTTASLTGRTRYDEKILTEPQSMIFGKNLGDLLNWNRGEQLDGKLRDAAVQKYLEEWKDILQVTAELRFEEEDQNIDLEDVRESLESHGIAVERYIDAVRERDRIVEGKNLSLAQQNLYEHITETAAEAGFRERKLLRQRSISDKEKDIEATTQYEVMSEIHPVGAAYWHLKNNPFGETSEDIHEFFTEELGYDQAENRPSTLREVEQLLQRAEDLDGREQWFDYSEDEEKIYPSSSGYAQEKLSDSGDKLLRKNLE